jgi:phage tail sheath protein FI
VSPKQQPRPRAPGVYLEHIYPEPEQARLPTAVPVFIGFASLREGYRTEITGPAWRITRWLQFTDQIEDKSAEQFLAAAVYGFFANGGRLCYVLPLNDTPADRHEWTQARLLGRLDALAALDQIDLVCAPGLMQAPARALGWGPARAAERAAIGNEAVEMQLLLLAHCDTLGNRFAILDALPGASHEAVLGQRGRLQGDHGALYYPWVGVRTLARDESQAQRAPLIFVPPCGHVAGVYARSDERVGVHKAPANEQLEEVLDLEAPPLTDADQVGLNEGHVNCLRSFPRRGIRVWGARSLSRDPERRYVNVQRLFITVSRWAERRLADTAFEPNGPQLWARIEGRLRDYCQELFRRGALAGAAPEQAFFVVCNAETNPDEVREAGQVITLVGLAPTAPGEFIEVRIIHGQAGVTLVGPGRFG